MSSKAIGLLETRGLTALVTGVDAMLKSANVTLAGPMKQVGNALVSAVVIGGASLTGGVGTVLGSILGIALLQTITGGP